MAATAVAPTLAQEVASFNEAKTAPVATPRQILPKVQFSPAPAQPAAKSVSFVAPVPLVGGGATASKAALVGGGASASKAAPVAKAIPAWSPALPSEAAKAIEASATTASPRALKKLVEEEAVVKRKPLAAINGTNRDAPASAGKKRRASASPVRAVDELRGAFGADGTPRTRAVAAARARATPLYKLADTLLVNADTVIATPSITPAAAPSGDLPPFSDTGSDPYDSASSAGTPRALVWDSPHLVWRWARAPGSAAAPANAGKKKKTARAFALLALAALAVLATTAAPPTAAPTMPAKVLPLAAPAPVLRGAPVPALPAPAKAAVAAAPKAGPLRRLLAPARKLLARLRADKKLQRLLALVALLAPLAAIL